MLTTLLKSPKAVKRGEVRAATEEREEGEERKTKVNIKDMLLVKVAYTILVKHTKAISEMLRHLKSGLNLPLSDQSTKKRLHCIFVN